MLILSSFESDAAMHIYLYGSKRQRNVVDIRNQIDLRIKMEVT